MKDSITVRVDGVAGWQEIVCEVKLEIKSDHCLTHRESISYCLTVSIMCCLRLRQYLLHEIVAYISSVEVKIRRNYTYSVRTHS